jgi:predicted esterase
MIPGISVFKPKRSGFVFPVIKGRHTFLFLFLLIIQQLLPAQNENSLLDIPKKQLEGFFYKELMESPDTATTGIPLVIALHWMGSTPDEFSNYMSGFTKKVRVLLIEGPYAFEGGYSFYPVSPQNYYRMPTDKKMQVLLEEGEKLSKFIDTVTRLYVPGIKPVIIGASQGGDLSYVIGIRYNHLVSLACPLLATVDNRIITPSRDKPKTLAPIIAFHGEEDPIVNVVMAKNHIKILKSFGYKANLYTYQNVKHEISATMKADFINVISKNLKPPQE